MTESLTLATESVGSRRRRQLLEATVSAMAEYGGPGASLSRIAERAGMSKAAVLYHVDNRDALIAAAVEAVFDRLARHCRQAIADAPDPRAAVFAYTEAALGYLWSHRSDLNVVTETPHVHLVAPGVPQSRIADLEEVIREGVRTEVLETSDVRTTALAIDGVIDAMAISGYDADSDGREGMIAETVNIVDRIITPRT